MSSDNAFIADPDDLFALAAIDYLAHNDFTDIRHISSFLIKAKDGKREVFVCVDSSPLGWAFVPSVIVGAAARAHARVDIIRIRSIIDGTADLKHLMNVVEAP